MKTYKIFKKSDSFLKFLTPIDDNSKSKVAKLVTESAPVIIGYNNEEEKYIEIHTCPRIYIGMTLRCRNIDNGQYEELGRLIDLEYRENIGYLFIFENNIEQL